MTPTRLIARLAAAWLAFSLATPSSAFALRPAITRAKVGLEEALVPDSPRKPAWSKHLHEYAEDDFNPGTVLTKAVPKNVAKDRNGRLAGVVVRVQAPSDGRGFDGFIPKSLASTYGDQPDGLTQLMDALRQDPPPVQIEVVESRVERNARGIWTLILKFKVVKKPDRPLPNRPPPLRSTAVRGGIDDGIGDKEQAPRGLTAEDRAESEEVFRGDDSSTAGAEEAEARVRRWLAGLEELPEPGRAGLEQLDDVATALDELASSL